MSVIQTFSISILFRFSIEFLSTLLFSGCVEKLLHFVDKCLEHPEHTYYDFYAGELAICLNKIATHTSNKALVVKCGGHLALHKLLKHAGEEEERVAGLQTLWNIAFSREAKEVLREQGKLMVLLRELARCGEGRDVRRCAAGVLWECEEKYDIQGTVPRNSLLSVQLWMD